MDFDLRGLEIFCRVVEHGSFTRGAEAVHLAQASVSERIANLEQAVGAPLLDRLGRRVEPTAVGRRLYERALALLEQKQALCFELEELLDVTRGTLVVAASTIPGDVILPGVIARFRDRFPDVLVQVKGSDSLGVCDLVEAGDAELGFVGAKDPRPGLTFRPLWADELVLAVPKGHALANRKRVRLAQVASFPWVLREPGSGTRQTLERALADAGADGADGLHVVAELGSTAAIKQAIMGGLGLSVLSKRALEVELDAGLLRAVRIEGLSMKRQFYGVSHDRRARSPLCQRFEAFVAEEADTP